MSLSTSRPVSRRLSRLQALEMVGTGNKTATKVQLPRCRGKGGLDPTAGDRAGGILQKYAKLTATWN